MEGRRPQGREGGSAREGTHIRFRDYIADAVYTVALALDPPEARPTLAEIEERDIRDRTREDSPLVQAEDAIYLDSSSLTAEQVVERMTEIVEQYRQG